MVQNKNNWSSLHSSTTFKQLKNQTKLQKDIDSKNQKIDAHEQLIKSQQKEIEALKESLASAIRNQQQEVETLKESQASEIRILMGNHAEDIAKTKTKVWCSNVYVDLKGFIIAVSMFHTALLSHIAHIIRRMSEREPHIRHSSLIPTRLLFGCPMDELDGHPV
ncbi:hypothetical protein DAPPUDRAFT_105090 [Daphnia pulex]|uniref:Uncharacterized protein n=1 Tax=Daphnia pulex TaxID=6669 RepID=E9GPE7_DAPPU|nr:hypothetical protein DAPPUDRAFT_105090 [Daphnia pulex]|eukprot:EFX78627.1 hypothetical protein DAPPUDRAFT_105090 [Daphnia pulex]